MNKNERDKAVDFISLLYKIRQFLCSRNIQGWLVGGALRDKLLNKVPADIDLLLKADKGVIDELNDFLKGVKVEFAQGELVRLVVGEEEPEFNIDIEILAEADVIDNLRKRDFTINALAVSLDEMEQEKILDPNGGLKDLQDKLIRAVNREVFLTDPVRILRALRLVLNLGFALEEKTEGWLKESVLRVDWDKVAGERIWKELREILSFSESAAVLKDVEEKTGFLSNLLRLSPHELKIELLIALEKLLHDEMIKGLYEKTLGGKDIIPVFKLALLLSDIKEKGRMEDICAFLRLAGWERDLILYLASFDREKLLYERIDEVYKRRFIYENKEYTPLLLFFILVELMAGSEADFVKYKGYIADMLEFYIEEGSCWFKIPNYIDGKEVMKILSLKSSPLVGKVLQMVAEEEIKGGITSKEEARRFVERLRYEGIIEK